MEVSQEKKKPFLASVSADVQQQQSTLFSLRRLCIFREVGHAMILLIPFCILLHYFFMTWTKFNWKKKFLKDYIGYVVKVSATWTS
jgi:hypothetical protein